MKTISSKHDGSMVCSDTEIQGDGSSQKQWPYRCPECDRETLYFKEIREPQGESTCPFCKKTWTGEFIWKEYLDREKSWQEKKNNRILRDLGFMGNGSVGRRKEENC